MSLEEDANKLLKYLYDRRTKSPTVVRPDEIGIKRPELKLAQEKLNHDSLAKLKWTEPVGHADGKILPDGITKIEGSPVPEIVAALNQLREHSLPAAITQAEYDLQWATIIKRVEGLI